MQLKEFGKRFGLDVHKEVMPYKIYTKENIDRVYIPILEAVQHMKDNNADTLISNIDKAGCRGEGHKFNYFNILKYSSEY